MSMPNIVKERQPLGYSGGQSESLPVMAFRAGMPEVVALFEAYCAPAAATKTWAFRKEIIKLASRLFSGGSNWFISVDQDTTVQEYNYQFVLDTVRYIATGRRRISIHSWPDLITHCEASAIDREHNEVRHLFRELALTTTHSELIQRWCQHPGGCDDLMFTLNILFGQRTQWVR